MRNLETPINKLQPSFDIKTYKYSRGTIFLFGVLVLYLVVPIIDVPLLRLSLSAPIFFLIALSIFLRPPERWISQYQLWIMLALFIWLGILISVLLNGILSGGIKVNKGQIAAVIQFGYWMLIFVATAYFVSYTGLARHYASLIAVGIAALAVLRWGEAILGGAIGYWSTLKLLTENAYGIQFSTFAPILLAFVFWGGKQKLAGIGVIILLGAVAINGSRSSWLAILIAFILFAWMFLRTQRHPSRVVFVLLFFTLVFGAGMLFAPRQMVSLVSQRFATLQQLDEDKSYAIRQVMVQKGLKLFLQSPLIGIGLNRWYDESVPLMIPRIMTYYTQGYFDSKSAHNSYVLFLAENGLIGSLPLAILLIILVIRGYRAAANLAKNGQIWALGIYAGFIGMSIHFWSLAGLTGTLPWFIYGMVVALIVLDSQLASNKTPSKVPENHRDLHYSFQQKNR
jgi:O-antigen ligase